MGFAFGYVIVCVDKIKEQRRGDYRFLSNEGFEMWRDLEITAV
jgi:hypothetical protein